MLFGAITITIWGVLMVCVGLYWVWLIFKGLPVPDEEED